jgi:hypothetical protein
MRPARRIRMLARPALAALALCSSLWAGAGCEGCREQAAAPAAPATGPAPAAAAPARVAHNALEARLAKRSLARDKSYPRGEDGSVQCAGDADCFIVQAERCTPARLEHLQSATGFGLEQRAASIFQIRGKGTGGCQLERQVTELRVRMAAQVEQLLQKQGKSASDLQAIRDTMLRKPRERNPPAVTCQLAHEQLLALALDLAEGRFDPAALAGCTPEEAPEPTQLSERAPEPAPPAKSATQAGAPQPKKRAPRVTNAAPPGAAE